MYFIFYANTHIVSAGLVSLEVFMKNNENL